MSLPIQLELPKGFLEPEARDGYEVSEKLKKIWAVELDLLSEFDRVCKKYHLRYLIAYGSMIGAVRHHGFIPWDDDLDVWVPRCDYEILRTVAVKEFKHPYFLQTTRSDTAFFNLFSRLRNSETTALVLDKASPNYNCGIFIDIYPVDHPVNNKMLERVFIQMQKMVARCACINRGATVGKSRWKSVAANVLLFWAKLIPFAAWSNLYDWTLMRGKPNGMYAPMFSICPHERDIRISEADFDDPVLMKFEMLQVPMARDYDKMMRVFYGDYMQFPPASERGKWHEGEILFDPDTPYKKWFAEHPEVRV